MKLEKQVVSLWLAKKLKELGVEQDSLFYYAIHFDGDRETYICFYEDELEKYQTNCGENEYHDDIFSAFTVAELGEMLPDEVKNKNNEEIFGKETNKTKYIGMDFWTEQTNNNYGVARVYRVSVGGKQFKEETEADARAKMLIYLLESKLL